MPAALSEPVRIGAHEPRWAELFRIEFATLRRLPELVDIEHIGSTAVAGLKAKPVIDIMASVAALQEVDGLGPALEALGYRRMETDFRKRRFFRKQIDRRAAAHLHILPAAAWPAQHERLFRDWLRGHPSVAAAYGALKQELARRHGSDRGAYTEAKTAFIQREVNAARADLGLPPQTDWDE